MSRPVLLKLGGSVISDKASKPRFRKTVTRRILTEVARTNVPCVITHGAGSFGHPPARHHEIGQRLITPERRGGVSEVLAGAGLLHAEVVQAAHEAGLRPVSVPVHAMAHSGTAGMLELPINTIQQLLEEGHAPVLSGTLVRDEKYGWRVVSADELMALLAPELEPRLGVFATDVLGVHDRDPAQEGAQLLPVLALEDLETIQTEGGRGDDVTGRMRGKLERAFAVAAECPTWIVDGRVRGRVQDVLKGKGVPGTRLEV